MATIEVAQTYFDAWNRHDPEGIVATFSEGGTYEAPASGGRLSGSAIGQYARGLFAAFPDLSFEIVSAAPTGADTVAAQWLMRGTNAGPIAGAPPTGKTVALPSSSPIPSARRPSAAAFGCRPGIGRSLAHSV